LLLTNFEGPSLQVSSKQNIKLVNTNQSQAQLLISFEKAFIGKKVYRINPFKGITWQIEFKKPCPIRLALITQTPRALQTVSLIVSHFAVMTQVELNGQRAQTSA